MGGDGGQGGAEPTGKACVAECFCEGEYCATVTKIDASYMHSCALLGSGNVWCWGSNAEGQVGVPGFADERRPKRVESIDDVIDLAIGYYHSCAVKSDGTVWCWGSNEESQLGDNGGVATITYTPVQVLTASETPLTGIGAIAAGELHTCALKSSDGSVWCWGDGLSGKLGNDATTDSPVAVSVLNSYGDPLTGAGRIFADAGLSAAHLTGGWSTWGLGDDRATAMVGGHDYTAMASSSGTAYGVDQAGDLWFWPGSNPPNHEQSPLFDDNAREVGVGYVHACVLKTNDVVACFGSEYDNGALGNGPATEAETPVDVLEDVAHLVGAEHHNCTIRNDDTVWCWGLNSYGQVGNDTDGHSVDVPVAVLPVQP